MGSWDCAAGSSELGSSLVSCGVLGLVLSLEVVDGLLVEKAEVGSSEELPCSSPHALTKRSEAKIRGKTRRIVRPFRGRETGHWPSIGDGVNVSIYTSRGEEERRI